MIARFAILRPVIALFWSTRRGMLLAGAVLAVTTVLAGIGLLGVSGWFITATAIAGLLPATAFAFDVFAPSAAIRLLALARTAARYGERMTTHEATLSVLAALREKLFRGFAAPQAAKSLEARPARLLNRLTADIDALDSLYLRVLVPAAVAILAALVTGFGLAFLHPLAGVLAATFLIAAGLGISARSALKAEKFSRRRAIGLEALRARTADLVSGQTELLTTGRLSAQVAAVKRADDYLAACDDSLNRIETNAGFSFGLSAAILLSAALLGMACLVEHGAGSAPAAALGLLVCFAALEPFTALRRGAMELGRTLFSARRIAPRLSATAEAHCPALPASGIAAELRGVRLEREGNEHPVLTNINLAIACGERVAIVGASGAGKTSLIQLVAGELHPAAGSVRALPSTLMTQRSQLFRDSIADNLRLAKPAATGVELWEALEAAGLAEHVRTLPKRLETKLGEAGQGLSGGQSRRLALARFLLADRPLWLLDEVTEGLDGETARDVLGRLFARVEGKTVLMITHNRREAEFADRIIVLREGRQFDECQSGTLEYGVVLETLRPD
ncbi:amino acid ABC transporter ATP-binding/permease protein [Agrobacterium fabrum]|uniref:ABC transporter, nucleotide binding/ATPase protein n=1 Tax=Agrobacterium fabrum (strain C58 / ATCC 33970) TaxID=176299 RepID=A9CG19_AGRFC|nr:amino acid ABC transporter ATP-binding/permease protein [Agrobacterium fabrum]KEY56356.1 ABC transporter ATP-binding protein [Agrobacterium tumefaciens]AAK89341.1 ABC transporter, nucleotide binding/ATPase protein [Agrobacterium fabrum str. C58]KJX86147.1 Lipid A export ATP-binding/permease protein msbA [Agrobacterium tumefaciens]MCX2877730.1 amino acid ABC transporter ATP-binding/permease protein [Agrobacterium fabrum]NMV72644.1 amino acid ABC transporter ATP-binding/permease protein [Agro